jgi:AhpC/TSA family
MAPIGRKNNPETNLREVFEQANPTGETSRRFILEIFIRMAQIEINSPAPDFTLPDYQGNEVTLSQFKGKQHVLLVFNRGFL